MKASCVFENVSFVPGQPIWVGPDSSKRLWGAQPLDSSCLQSGLRQPAEGGQEMRCDILQSKSDFHFTGIVYIQSPNVTKCSWHLFTEVWSCNTIYNNNIILIRHVMIWPLSSPDKKKPQRLKVKMDLLQQPPLNEQVQRRDNGTQLISVC